MRERYCTLTWRCYSIPSVKAMIREAMTLLYEEGYFVKVQQRAMGRGSRVESVVLYHNMYMGRKVQ